MKNDKKKILGYERTNHPLKLMDNFSAQQQKNV